MKLPLPSISIVTAPPVRGVPFPDETFEPADIADPQQLRDLLHAQAMARELLPFVDTRAAHWRYYLFRTPPSRGRPIEVRKRLKLVLDKTSESRAGIGRRDYKRFESDGRRSEERFLNGLDRSFRIAYESATRAFWRPDRSFDPPSSSLCGAARKYVVTGDFEDFFSEARGPDKLRRMFRLRLIGLRRELANHIIKSRYDLVDAAAAAARSSRLDNSTRLLFLTWALLQAYFGWADDGTLEEAEDELSEEESGSDIKDEQYRILARATLQLIDKVSSMGDLERKQVTLICERLKSALKSKGHYQPPVRLWKLKNDGRRRRVFASLRLFAYARLLRTTGEAS